MSPSAVSHAVRSVEDRLAIPLFARTTRSVSRTEARKRFIAGVEPALTDIVKTVEGLTAERGEVTGLLRIDAPRVVFEMALRQILAKLARQRPRLTVARSGPAKRLWTSLLKASTPASEFVEPSSKIWSPPG
jgi:DNA-binding transcriptional LysR family regulator